MNAAIALCSFCESHGPRVVLCTQAFHDPELILSGSGNKADATPKSIYGPSELFDSLSGEDLASQASTSKIETCEGCSSMGQAQRGYISNDDEARVSYITSQYPLHSELFTKIKQACVRSLSCEVSAEGDSSFFGNEHIGYALNHPFSLADSRARGFRTSYSIIIMMKDKVLLLNSWKFFNESLKEIVRVLQEKANWVHADEQSKVNQRAVRLNDLLTQLVEKTFKPKHKAIQTRSMKDLTNDQEIFSCLHDWFVWILYTGAIRIKEQLVEGSPTEDTKVAWEQLQGSGDLVEADLETKSDYLMASAPDVDKDLSAMAEATNISNTEKCIDDTELTFSSVRELYNVLGREKFHILAYHTVIGNQIIVKGQYLSLTKSLITCLEILLPKGCSRPLYNSTTYEDSWKCNFLGVLPEVSIPDHVNSSELHIQIIITEKEDKDTTNLENFDFTFIATAKLPEKVPQVLCEMERVISDTSFSLGAMNSFIFTQKQIWLNKVKMVNAYSHADQFTEAGISKLSGILGAKEQDMQVIKFWRAGLSQQHKTSVLTSAIKQKYETCKEKLTVDYE